MEKILFLSLLFLTACEQPTSQNNENQNAHRWYTQQQRELGSKVYQQHCVQCHKKDAMGTDAWKVTRLNGVYPPPPLNGTAHAWHHDMETLTRTIKEGGIPLGGVMPGFEKKLSTAEIGAVIAYFQSFWSDETYTSWIEIGGLEVGD